MLYHANETYWEMIDHLREQQPLLGVEKFQELQKCLGLNYDADTLLFEDTLRQLV